MPRLPLTSTLSVVPESAPARPNAHRPSAVSLATEQLLENLPESVRNLARRGMVRTYRKGTMILEEGTYSDALYVVLQGQAKAFSSDDRGREITFGVHGPGDYFGEMSLDGGPRSASVLATEAITCALVTRQTLRDHIAAEPDFALALLARVIQRARDATHKQRSMALDDVYSRVRQLLDGLATPQADGTRLLKERLTHAEIASRVGCSREMVSRLLKDLERGGYIELRLRLMVLLKKLPARW
jgi:CRP/FNR family transcriptional regulator, cyclic AMP receptor protein